MGAQTDDRWVLAVGGLAGCWLGLCPRCDLTLLAALLLGWFRTSRRSGKQGGITEGKVSRTRTGSAPVVGGCWPGLGWLQYCRAGSVAGILRRDGAIRWRRDARRGETTQGMAWHGNAARPARPSSASALRPRPPPPSTTTDWHWNPCTLQPGATLTLTRSSRSQRAATACISRLPSPPPFAPAIPSRNPPQRETTV